ncbi:MAG TPA: magnesium transporter [Gammaproteobacteria bacterium]|nr:magnesium transporter [Gammaproteobacteria bacterium]
MEVLEPQPVENKLDKVSSLLRSGRLNPVRQLLKALTPGEIAHLLESLPPYQRKLVWGLVDSEVSGDVLVELGEEARSGLIDDMETGELLDATEGMETDDLADLVQTLPETITDELLRRMTYSDRQRLETVLAYDEDTAGGLMNTDTVTVRSDVTIDVVFRYLRVRGELPEHTDSLMVVNRFGYYLGALPLSRLVTSDVNLTVEEVMNAEAPAIPANMPESEVAKLFEQRDLVSAAVVDEAGRLLGRITVDDVVDVIRDEAGHNLLSHAGLNEEDDIFAPVVPCARRRAVWLGVNLLTAFMASWVIGQFQDTLEKYVALAVLMPVVASMGGIAGTQTLTLMIRGLALDQVRKDNTRWLMYKELAVGFLNGVFWAAVVAWIAILWFRDMELGMIIAVALIVNLLIAALSGVVLPLVLKRLSIDPALAGGVVLTTITDVIGFFVFLGLATVVLR